MPWPDDSAGRNWGEPDLETLRSANHEENPHGGPNANREWFPAEFADAFNPHCPRSRPRWCSRASEAYGAEHRRGWWRRRPFPIHHEGAAGDAEQRCGALYRPIDCRWPAIVLGYLEIGRLRGAVAAAVAMGVARVGCRDSSDRVRKLRSRRRPCPQPTPPDRQR